MSKKKPQDNSQENPVEVDKEIQYIYLKDSVTGEEFATLNPAYAREQKKKHFKFYLQYSGIPKDYWDINIRNIQISEDLRSQAVDFINDIEIKKTSLYLWGSDNTTGKTSLACAIGQELIKKGYDCYFGLARDIINALMKTTGFSSDQYNEEAFSLTKRLSTADIIIIDDIFDPKKSIHWTTANNNLIVSEWDRLIRASIGEGKKFFLTSNKSK
jgi:DNA replication protein DnaC